MAVTAEDTKKRCSGCGRVRPRTDFYLRKRSRDGLNAWCVDCSREATREHQGRVADHRATVDAAEAAGLRMCRKGHVMTPENTHTPPSGGRRCRECLRAADRRRYRKDREKRRAVRRYRETDQQERRTRVLARYGLTEASYQDMLEAQGGGCAICGTDTPGGRWNNHFPIDHDHETGAVRGLLCSNCNVMLGNAGDDAARLRAGAAYLERTA